MGNAVVR